MESLTSSSPIDTKLPNIRHTVRLSFYQILIVIVGCTVISFRAGLIISTNRRNRAVQPQDRSLKSNITIPKTAIAGALSECNSLFEIGYPNSKTPHYVNITQDITDSDRCSAANSISIEMLHEIRHNHHQRISITLWSGNNSVLHHDEDSSATVEFFEAMVHPSLLIHPNPYRIVILDDIGGQLLRQVLKHKNVHEVIYIVTESFESKTLSSNLSDSRVVVVYANNPEKYFHDSLPIDVLFMDVTTYVTQKSSGLRLALRFVLLNHPSIRRSFTNVDFATSQTRRL